MPVVQGKVGGHVVSVLRDSGCSTAVVKAEYVRAEQLLNRKQRVVLIDKNCSGIPSGEGLGGYSFLCGAGRSTCDS